MKFCVEWVVKHRCRCYGWGVRGNIPKTSKRQYMSQNSSSAARKAPIDLGPAPINSASKSRKTTFRHKFSTFVTIWRHFAVFWKMMKKFEVSVKWPFFTYKSEFLFSMSFCQFRCVESEFRDFRFELDWEVGQILKKHVHTCTCKTVFRLSLSQIKSDCAETYTKW